MATYHETNTISREDGTKRLLEVMKDVQFCMMTTVGEGGEMHSRPMTLQQAEFDGTVWLFTSKSGRIADEIAGDERVNLTFTSKDMKSFVTMSGTARLTRDEGKMKELWKPLHKAWFPDGLEDPDLVLVRVDVARAEYWDSNGTMTTILEMVRAIATGDRAKPGEHQTVEFEESRR
jgi:general stress protein 26